jgi:hypothetical protein
MDKLIRQTHRWLSIITTVAVIINVAALIMKSQAFWIGFLALVPLLLLMVTGLYMFFRPYFARKAAA